MLTRPNCHPWHVLLNMSAPTLGSHTWCEWRMRPFPASDGESPDRCAPYFSSPDTHTHTHTHAHTHTHTQGMVHTHTHTHTPPPQGMARTHTHTHPAPWGWPQLNYLLFQGQLDLWSVLPSLNTHPRESLTLSWDTVLWHVFKPVEERGRTSLGQWRKEDGPRWANITRKECLPPNATLDPVLSGRNMFSQQSVI